jgi:hypothetical protein
LSGTRSWPPGPSKVDWTLDFADLEFGPLRSGSTLDEVKRHLGRPSHGTWFSTPGFLSYPALNLRIDLEDEKLFGLEISWEDPSDDAGFDPRIRLSEGSYATARTVTEERITAAFGQPGSEDREKAAMISWYRRDDVIFVDLSDNGKIVGIGFF